MNRAVSAVIAALLLLGCIAETQAQPKHKKKPPKKTPCNEGVQRWAIKVASDPASKPINAAKPVDITIHELSARKQPIPWSATMKRRTTFNAAPPKKSVEGTAWRVSEVILVKWKLEPDQDIHLIVQDPDPKFKTLMTVEFPRTDCPTASKSTFNVMMQAARTALTKKFGNPPRAYQALKGTANIVGIGFFDKRHGQAGANPIELHPALSFFAGP